MDICKYAIGQILTAKRDLKVEKAMSGEIVEVKKDSKVIIGADKLAHHWDGSIVQPLAKDIVVEGYDASGLATWIAHILLQEVPCLADVIEDYDINVEDFQQTIESALEEVGFYEKL